MWKTLLLLSIFFWISIDCYIYCNLSCGAEHYACKLQPCAPSIICGRNYKVKIMTRNDRKKLLGRFNEVRNTVASGSHYSLFNIMSDGMKAVVYDMELEFLAQCWANFCKGRHVRDTCRSTTYSNEVGSVSYVFTNFIRDEDNPTLALDEALLVWTSPQVSFREKVIQEYSSAGLDENARNFLQIIVGRAEYVGCGRILFGLQKHIFIVCYFSPGNLIEKKEVYSRGTPNCYDNLEPFKYLCGKIHLNSYRHFVPPSNDYLGKETGNVNVINKEIVLIMVVIWFLFGFEIVNL